MTKKKPKNVDNSKNQFKIETAPKDSINIGTPPAVLFPARNYKFKIINDNVTINISRTGSYVDLAPEIFTEEDGTFNLFDEGNNTLYTPSVTKVLFAEHKYPDMEANQLFVLIAFRIKEDSVDVVGQIIEVLPR